MTRGLDSRGFTIVETMIFLAVSAAILVSSLRLLSGAQNSTLFTQGMNDINEQITAVVNNVANGYYPRAENMGCSVNGTGDALDFTGTQTRGTADSCVFIGRVMQFSTTSDTAKVYSIAGRRLTAGNTEVSDMQDSLATALSTVDEFKLKNNIKVEQITTDGNPTMAIGFFTSFGQPATDNQLQSGGLSTDFIGLNTDDVPNLVVGSSFRTGYTSSTNKNPSDGIQLCFKSGTTNQFGVITLGGKNKTATSQLVIKDAC